MEPFFDANLANWDECVGIHLRSEFYGVEQWLRDAPGPRPREIDALGDVEGKTLVHLQCHFGMDTLQWARAGATVTGVDFSPMAIEAATALAIRAGLADRATFVCANVYDAPAALAGQRFDVAYVSLGALCWLPDVARWGEVVASVLAPGGRLYLHDVHPLSSCLDDEEHVVYGYFEEPDSPFVGDWDTSYTDGGTLTATRTYEWNHSIGETVMALIDQGLVIDSLIEHDWTVFRQFPSLVEISKGCFAFPVGRPRMPLSFTVLATRRDR